MVKLATKEFMLEIDKKAEEMKKKILTSPDTIIYTGKAHYVAADGNDENDGLSPEKAWKTNKRVSDASKNGELCEGDAVLFKRGDIFRGQVIAAPGVTYAAYGSGDKPKIYGYEVDLADPCKWEVYNAEKHIWKYTDKILDAGTLVFNHGEKHSIKLIPTYTREGRFVLRDNTDVPFVMEEQMVRDLDIFSDTRMRFTEPPADDEKLFPVPMVTQDDFGDLYLRCDGGNPGEIFDSIEILPKRNTFAIGGRKNVRIDNLCIKYCGAHGIGGGGSVEGLRVTNCEIGWIGGSIQHYNGSNARCGIVTRYGNGIEIYGACKDYTVDNCWVYQCYDAGLTHQASAGAMKRDVCMTNVYYTNNLLEDSVYNIEYFLSETQGTNSIMDNFEISGNIMRRAGNGWGRQRYNPDSPANIKSWSSTNPAKDYRIFNNIIDRGTQRLVHIIAQDNESLPNMHDNIYIQPEGGKLGFVGVRDTETAKTHFAYDDKAPEVLAEVMGEKNSEFYYYNEE